MRQEYSTYTDDRLFALFSSSHHEAEAAFGELFKRYAPRVHAYCARITGNRELAEDIFQETFIRFFKSARPDRVMANVPGFLFTIARNLYLQSKRTRHVSVTLDDLELRSPEHNPYEVEELQKMITMGMELLDYEQREAFVLREYDGLSYHEIAEIMGLPAATARTHVFRAKQKLRQILAPYFENIKDTSSQGTKSL